MCLHARLGWLGAVLEEGAQAGRVAAGDVGEARAEVELLAEQLRSTVGRGEGQGVRRAVRGESEGKGEGEGEGKGEGWGRGVGVGGGASHRAIEAAEGSVLDVAQERACLIGRSGVGAGEVQGQVLERGWR